MNRNGYMGFSVDLKPWISYEHENIIRIDVDNSKQPNSRWYSGSGIYRDVNLWTGKDVYISHDKLRITTLSVNDDMAVIEVCAQLKNIIGHGLEAECLIEIKRWAENCIGYAKSSISLRANADSACTNTD